MALPSKVTVKVDLRGIPSGAELQGVLVRAMTKATALFERAAKLNVSGRILKVRTGRLRSSIHGTVEQQGTRVVGRVGTNVFYGAVHEYGAVIVPVRASLLRFTVGGRTIFAKRVRLPARPWLRTAVQESAPRVPGIFEAEVQALVRAKGNPG